MTRLEIAVTTFEDALTAQAGGAHSVEIAVDLAHDGLTPPLEMVQQACRELTLDVHVIVRPTSRDFIYTPSEQSQIFADIRAFRDVPKLKGIVFGAHLPDGKLDIALMKQVVQEAGQLQVTLHRALDTCTNPDESLTQLKYIIPRVLTSGPAKNAWEGRDALRAWVQQFGSDFEFVASGGLKRAFLPEYLAHTRVHVCHIGGDAQTDGKVDIQKVQELLAIVTS